MNIRTASIFLSCIVALSDLKAESPPIYLAKAVTVETENGVARYPAGTQIMAEGDKYKVGEFLLSLPANTVTTKYVAAVLPRVHLRATPTPAPKVASKENRAPAPTSIPSRLQTSGPLGANSLAR